MPERVLKLSNEISKIAARSIEEILAVTKRTHLLAINAQIESAHAGEAGKGFNVVAEEVKKVSESVQVVSEKMTQDLEGRLNDLQQLGQLLVSQVRGNRLADLALHMIDIIDRNLYERSCDVRWWATDSAVVDCLQDPSPENIRHCVHRLGVILSSYTVYLDLWVADQNGKVIANARPNLYTSVLNSNVSSEKWFKDAMRTRNGEDFASEDVESKKLLNNLPVATYSTAIRKGGEVGGAPIGALGIFFDWAKQSEAVVREVALSDDERQRTRCMLLDSKMRIIAAWPNSGVLNESFPLKFADGNRTMGNYTEDDGSVVGYALTPGYESYKGMGWYGVIHQKQSAT